MVTQFHGFCSFPHGGWVLSGLILSCCSALAASMWGVASCRFMFVDFTTDRGDFSNFYRDPTPDGDAVSQRVGAGLFSWLVPNSADNWSDGQCAGYSEIQRDHFSDSMFEASRIFSVLAVLGGMGATLWVLFLSCMSLGRFQIWMMSTILGFVTIFTAMTFLIFQSSLCTDLTSYQDASHETGCTIDQGGLVVIAATLFWAVAFLISVVYIKTPERDLTLRDGKIANAFELRQQNRLQREKQRRLNAANKRQDREVTGSHRETSANDVSSYAEGDTEVQLR
ncbi:hypothetical protein IV203_030033 [Nitzschia inconspicua]|uniref:Uncharacterized protein n=1 Tax=Nitzschia inconspicua TaxID=303405 RepID=A0A9K3Q0X7_9STRA|nr:hypothetical protein IV203_030033 [Nitzschia inconspicua]